MINYLILNYVQQHLSLPHQVGFLTGHRTYSTYNIRLEFTVPQGKRDYSILREDLEKAFKDLQIESNYEYDQQGVTFLADLNADKHHRIKEMLDQRTADGSRINYSMKIVEEIGEEEKRVLLRRFNRGGGGGNSRYGGRWTKIN